VSEPQAQAPTPAETEPEVTLEANLADEMIADDLLVEEVSIDGMCGVY
jgi:mycofactocin precursor